MCVEINNLLKREEIDYTMAVDKFGKLAGCKNAK
jgi:hypothetical protein